MENRTFLIGLIRAFAGAILFAFPILMTMEMWHLGFHISPFRLALFIVFSIPLLGRLNYYGGFEKPAGWLENLLDSFSVYTVAVVASTIVLYLFAIIGPGMSADEIIGKIAVQSVPAAIGGMLSRNQLGEKDKTEERRKSASYTAGIFLLAVGALYLSLSQAATEEMILISFKMKVLHTLGLIVFSLLIMHGFMHAVVAKNKTPVPAGTLPFRSLFLRFTIPAYTYSLLITLYILWTLGRTDHTSVEAIIESTIVLGFPAVLGAGAARLII